MPNTITVNRDHLIALIDYACHYSRSFQLKVNKIVDSELPLVKVLEKASDETLADIMKFIF